MKKNVLEMVEGMHQDRLDEFHKIVYGAAKENQTWAANFYHGHQMWKWPCDMFLFHDLIWEIKPALIIETGTYHGASALYYAHQMDQIGHGQVLTIDMNQYAGGLPSHPRIAYLTGRSSVHQSVEESVHRWLEWTTGPVIVVLDSDHSKKHVLAELDLYAPLVSAGSFLVLEDTNVNGHPVYPEHGPGPYEALQEWLPRNPGFKVDEDRAKKYLFSFHTWLRKRRL